jgi:hydroxymethylglutaryl-CoA reductase
MLEAYFHVVRMSTKTEARALFAAVLLPSGRVLAVGGGAFTDTSAEIYNPSDGDLGSNRQHTF